MGSKSLAQSTDNLRCQILINHSPDIIFSVNLRIDLHSYFLLITTLVVAGFRLRFKTQPKGCAYILFFLNLNLIDQVILNFVKNQ